jgi:hypothetical protein
MDARYPLRTASLAQPAAAQPESFDDVVWIARWFIARDVSGGARGDSASSRNADPSKQAPRPRPPFTAQNNCNSENPMAVERFRY